MSQAKPQETIEVPSIDFSAHELGNFDMLVEKVFHVLKSSFGFQTPSVLLYEPQTNSLKVVRFLIPRGIEVLVKKTIGKKISEIEFSLEEKDNAFVKAFMSKSIYISDSVGEMAIPFFNTKAITVFDTLLNLKMAVVVPIKKENKIIGLFGFSSSDKSTLTNQERLLLETFASEVGVYLEKLWQMKCLKREKNQLLSSHHQIKEYVKINAEFLKEIDKVILGMKKEFHLSESKAKEVDESLKYLRSLLLISDKYQKQDNHDKKRKSTSIAE